MLHAAGPLLLAACAAQPAPPDGTCRGEGPVSASLGGSAGMGVGNDGPLTDLDVTFTTIVRPGRSAVCPGPEGRF